MTPVEQIVMPGLALERISHTYRNGRGLRPVSLAVAPGEVCALIGRSGSGKSTLLAIAGLVLTAQTGRVVLDGEDVSEADDRSRDRLRARAIRLVWQDHALIDYLTAWENVAVQRGRALGRYKDEAVDALAQVGLGHVADSRPSTLSGGERQRVATARALVGAPALVLADEPTGNLDATSASSVLAQLRAGAERGAAVLVASHDDLVIDAADRVVRL